MLPFAALVLFSCSHWPCSFMIPAGWVEVTTVVESGTGLIEFGNSKPAEDEMPARSKQRVCVLNEVEAHYVEQQGVLADCRNHRHWGTNRAIEEIASGVVRMVRPKRSDSRKAVVMLSKPQKPELVRVPENNNAIFQIVNTTTSRKPLQGGLMNGR